MAEHNKGLSFDNCMECESEILVSTAFVLSLTEEDSELKTLLCDRCIHLYRTLQEQEMLSYRQLGVEI